MIATMMKGSTSSLIDAARCRLTASFAIESIRRAILNTKMSLDRFIAASFDLKR